MKSRKLIYTVLAFFAVLLFASHGFAEGSEEEVVQVVEQSRPMYERFGMTSSQLFWVMCGFTLVLIFVLVGMAYSLRNIVSLKLKDELKKYNKVILLLFTLGVSGSSFAAEGEATKQAFENKISRLKCNFFNRSFHSLLKKCLVL